MTNDAINAFIVGSSNALPVFLVTQASDATAQVDYASSGFAWGLWFGVVWLLVFATRRALKPSRFGQDG